MDTFTSVPFRRVCVIIGLAAVAACSDAADPNTGGTTPDAGDSDSARTPVVGDGGAKDGGPTDAAPDAAPDASLSATSGTGSYASNLTDFALKVQDVGVRYSPAHASGAGFKASLKLYLQSNAGYCSDYAASIRRANSTYLKLEIERTGATIAEAELGPGTYAVDHLTDGAGDVFMGRQSLDATCSYLSFPMPFSLAETTINKIVFTQLDTTHVKGTYELRAADGRFVQGAFDADVCTAVPAGTSTCK
jgi:hypothetical protein